MCDVKVFLTFSLVVKILRGSSLLTEFGTALITILPILFQYCYKYCYSDSRNI
jgi:hypothetical protein